LSKTKEGSMIKKPLPTSESNKLEEIVAELESKELATIAATSASCSEAVAANEEFANTASTPAYLAPEPALSDESAEREALTEKRRPPFEAKLESDPIEALAA
jgi:hypothetical protein